MYGVRWTRGLENDLLCRGCLGRTAQGEGGEPDYCDECGKSEDGWVEVHVPSGVLWVVDVVEPMWWWLQTGETYGIGHTVCGTCLGSVVHRVCLDCGRLMAGHEMVSICVSPFSGCRGTIQLPEGVLWVVCDV